MYSVRVIPESANIDDICSRINVRSKKEILDKADLIYRMDWACIDALMHGMNCPGEMNPGVVQARHKTLNWLIGWGNGDWDSVDTPT